jgi:hypothetical protein
VVLVAAAVGCPAKAVRLVPVAGLDLVATAPALGLVTALHLAVEQGQDLVRVEAPVKELAVRPQVPEGERVASAPLAVRVRVLQGLAPSPENGKPRSPLPRYFTERVPAHSAA